MELLILSFATKAPRSSYIEWWHTTLGSIVINLVVEYPSEVSYLQQFHAALNELYWCIIIISIHMLFFALFFDQLCFALFFDQLISIIWSAMFWINQRCIWKPGKTIIILVIYSIKIGARQINYILQIFKKENEWKHMISVCKLVSNQNINNVYFCITKSRTYFNPLTG